MPRDMHWSEERAMEDVAHFKAWILFEVVQISISPQLVEIVETHL